MPPFLHFLYADRAIISIWTIRIADRMRRLLGLVGESLGVALFTVSSTACGLASGVRLLVLARVVQGIGAALLVPGSFAIICASFSERERGPATSITGARFAAESVAPRVPWSPPQSWTHFGDATGLEAYGQGPLAAVISASRCPN
jgi:hypothetical protein